MQYALTGSNHSRTDSKLVYSPMQVDSEAHFRSRWLAGTWTRRRWERVTRNPGCTEINQQYQPTIDQFDISSKIQSSVLIE